MSTIPPISASILPDELTKHAMSALSALEGLPPMTQLAALKAAVGIAEASVDHQTRLYMLGSILTKR